MDQPIQTLQKDEASSLQYGTIVYSCPVEGQIVTPTESEEFKEIQNKRTDRAPICTFFSLAICTLCILILIQLVCMHRDMMDQKEMIDKALNIVQSDFKLTLNNKQSL